MTTKPEPSPEPVGVPFKEGSQIVFDYEKGNLYRVIHVDGAHGGLSPDGTNIVMSVFNERKPIPKTEKPTVSSQGGLVPDPAPDSRGCDVLREVEATLIMNLETAAMLTEWLGRHTEQLKQVREFRSELEARHRKGGVS